MNTRRKFLAQATIGSLAAMSPVSSISCTDRAENPDEKTIGKKPLVISTWGFGLQANEGALKVLNSGGKALDAVEQGVRIIEADGSNSSVGYGGLPDREGHVTLDACIMDGGGMCGSVCALEHIVHPVTVARKVMEQTPHVILVGEGALQFALAQGMKKENLLTKESEAAWKEWLEEAKYKPIINIENHDTIGMVALDKNGDMAGACTTSGLAYKMRGRVGDSPIIGAGLYVDNEVGGAAATGLGEAVLRTLGSFLVVELMRQGKSPKEACREAVLRIKSKHANYKDFQVGFIAMNKKGETGGFSIHEGFGYAVGSEHSNELVKAESLLE
ncbi:MAG TPA: glycosylasparaginase [Bacteroidetes bacterium]|nr:glycosylasparaginase [Bacteroidota bacterium]